MNIAVVLTGTLKGSGFASRICSMVDAYSDAGHEVDIFHAPFPDEEPPPEPFRSRLRRYHRHFNPYGGERVNHLHLYPPQMRAGDRMAGEWEALRTAEPYDVVQCETVNVWPLARRLRARKRILVFHDDDVVRVRRIARHQPDALRRVAKEVSALKYRLLQWPIGARHDACWFVSEVEMRRALAQRSGLNALLVPNGASTAFYEIEESAADAGPVVTFVGPAGNPSNPSGVRWFLDEVWPRVLRDAPTAELRLVGVGWDHVYPPGSHPRVVTVGYTDDLPAELGRARVVVAPLLSGGGTKLKVIEAMATARPVVATAVAAEGVPSSAGLMVMDDAAGSAKAVCRWLADPDAAAAAGLANRAAAADLSWPAIWSRALTNLDQLAGVPAAKIDPPISLEPEQVG